MIQGTKVAIEQTLEEIFGAYSTEYRRYSPAAVLNGGPVSLSMGRAHQDYRFRDYYDKSRQASITTLEQAIQGLLERQADLETMQAAVTDFSGNAAEVQQFSHRIFVVHGREGEHREAVARFLEQLGLEAVILHEQPNKGRALITKFSGLLFFIKSSFLHVHLSRGSPKLREKRSFSSGVIGFDSKYMVFAVSEGSVRLSPDSVNNFKNLPKAFWLPANASLSMRTTIASRLEMISPFLPI